LKEYERILLHLTRKDVEKQKLRKLAKKIIKIPTEIKIPREYL